MHGTSLAGQVVGNGVVVDVSRYMNPDAEINEKSIGSGLNQRGSAG